MKISKLLLVLTAPVLALAALSGCNAPAEAPSGESSSSTSSIAPGPSTSDTTSTSDTGTSDTGAPSSTDTGGSDTSTPTSTDTGTSDTGAPSSTDTGGSDTTTPTSTDTGTSDTGPASTDTGGSDTSTPVSNDWTDEQKQLMRQKLHGLVLPFVSMGVTVEIPEHHTDEIRIQSQDNMAEGFLASYAALFTEEDGWLGGDVSAEVGYYFGCAYAFVKKVSTDEGNRYVSVFFAGMSNGNYDPTGRLYLEALDPYVYEYPSQFIGLYLQNTYHSSLNIPAFPADYYSLAEEGVLLCGTENANAEAAFREILVNSGNFTVEEQKDGDGYYRAHPKDGAYLVLFRYDAEHKALEICVSAVKGWNAEAIAAFFAKYGATPFEIPVLEGEDFTFSLIETQANPNMPGYESATISLAKLEKSRVKDYLALYTRAGYELIGDVDLDQSVQNFIMASLLIDEGIANVQLTYFPQTKTLEIFLNLHFDTSKTKAWPAAAVKEAAKTTQDSVPAYAQANKGFGFQTTSGHSYVVVYVEEGTEAAAQTNYISTLKGAGYTEYGTYQGQPRYKSAHSEVSLAISCDATHYPGQIEILITPMNGDAWPADEIARRLSAMGVTQDGLPSLDGVSYTEVKKSWVEENEEFKLWIDVGAANIESAIDVYEDILDKADFDYEGGVWISPNKEFKVTLTTGSDTNCLYIFVANVYGAWPGDQVGVYTTALFEALNDTVPVPQGYAAKANSFDAVYDALSETLSITGTYRSETAAQSAAYDYQIQLNRGFEYSRDDERGYAHYVGTELDLCVYSSGKLMIIEVRGVEAEAPEPVTWPNDSIKAIVGDYQIPDLSVEGALAYQVSSMGEGSAMVGYGLPADADKTEIVSTLAGKLDTLGYRYDEESGLFSNGVLDVSIGVLESDILVVIISVHSEEAEPVAWPEGDILDILGEYDVPDLSLESALAYEVNENEGAALIAYGLPEDADVDESINAVKAILDDLEDYEYDEKGGLYSNGTLDIAVNKVEGVLVVSISIHEEAEPASWPEEEIQAIIGDYEIPDLSLEGVASYEVDEHNGGATVTYTFDGTVNPADAMDAIYDMLKETYGFEDCNWDYWNHQISVSYYGLEENSLTIIFSAYGLPEEGYGIVFSSKMDYEAGEEAGEYGGFQQYLISDYEFREGDVFRFYDFERDNPILLYLENAEGYIEYDEENDRYVVLQDFTADVYIKLQYENDHLYLDIKD